MRLVIVESPYAGNVPVNSQYARAAMRDCLYRGEAPFVSHLLYTQVLNDDEPAERLRGITAGLAWGRLADATVVYVDLGVSRGMNLGIAAAQAEGRPVEIRSIPDWRIDMSEPYIRVVINVPVGTATLSLYASPPNEEVAIKFYDWLKAHKFKVAIVGASDWSSSTRRRGRSSWTRWSTSSPKTWARAVSPMSFRGRRCPMHRTWEKPKTCAVCGEKIKQHRRGRPRVICPSRPCQRARCNKNRGAYRTLTR